MSDHEVASAHLRRSLDVLARAADDAEFNAAVPAIAQAIEKSLRGGGKVMLAGNGGSAADAQHIAGEFLSRLRFDRHPLPAIALTTDSSVLTAVGNDYGYDRVFERPLRGLGRRGDVLFGISTSGRSPNVVRALAAAREMGIVTVGMLGGQGQPALEQCDLALLVPDSETARIQECHIALGHAVLELLEDRLVARPIA